MNTSNVMQIPEGCGGSDRDQEFHDEDEEDKMAVKAAIAKLTSHREKAKSATMEIRQESFHGWHPIGDARELDDYTRKTLNTVLLIRHLRHVADTGTNLSLTLVTLAADVLDGKCKASKRRFTLFDRQYLYDLWNTAKGELEKGDSKELAIAGLKHVPATKGKLSSAALKLAAQHVGLTPRAFKDRLNPSSKRGKRG